VWQDPKGLRHAEALARRCRVGDIGHAHLETGRLQVLDPGTAASAAGALEHVDRGPDEAARVGTTARVERPAAAARIVLRFIEGSVPTESAFKVNRDRIGAIRTPASHAL
jgi:hypothetical protein